MKRFIEQDVHEQEIKKLKLEFENTYQQIKKEAIKVINKMKKEIKEKDKIIDELVELYMAINDFTSETYNFVESKEELVENTIQEEKEINVEKLDENNNKETIENEEPKDLSKYNYVYHETFGEKSENELYY
ncbi:11851_t:CDS:2 [Dentiscutata erythropus]|uniref:11851_t:CDS:1 n=1 Tax=Dentiscutata erythropus TaxID=1348616 RepID=A0A9N9K2E6_9GLOM|nr:11851_t:CDS:2 [Dentiscutata erythropus]